MTHPARRGGSLIDTFKAVGWSFFGVRKGSDHEKDLAQLNPVHIIVVAFIAVLVFVGALIVLVRWVAST